MSTDFPVIVDGREVTALVDTADDFSIMSDPLADNLEKVKTQ